VGIGQKIAAIIMVNIRPIDQYFTWNSQRLRPTDVLRKRLILKKNWNVLYNADTIEFHTVFF
jgi:hypothetical protein